jgi:MFS family permease
MHWAATLAIIIILADSALSGLSQSMAELIAFRAIQGLGAGIRQSRSCGLEQL